MSTTNLPPESKVALATALTSQERRVNAMKEALKEQERRLEELRARVKASAKE